MAKVSLIMLVYKTEQYIEKSLRSALEQTFDDLEIVIVNDATPDGAMTVVERVLEEYPHRKEQVKIISHPTNMGTATARQTAIDHASGEYTIHLDSDDWVDPLMVERLYGCAKREGADIVVCDFYLEYADRQERYSLSAPSTGKEYFRALMRTERWVGLCNQFIHKSLYTNNNIGWVPGLNLREDILVTMKLALCTDRVAYLPEAFLHYNKCNTNSLTYVQPNVFDQTTKVMAEIERFVNTRPDASDYAEDILYHKVLIRGMLLKLTRGVERRKAARLYPEVPRRYIFRQQAPLRHMLSDYLASCGLVRKK